MPATSRHARRQRRPPPGRAGRAGTGRGDGAGRAEPPRASTGGSQVGYAHTESGAVGFPGIPGDDIAQAQEKGRKRARRKAETGDVTADALRASRGRTPQKDRKAGRGAEGGAASRGPVRTSREGSSE